MLCDNFISETDTSSFIVAGDLSTTLNKCSKAKLQGFFKAEYFGFLIFDRHGGMPWKEINYKDSVCDLMVETGIVDICRLLHPKTNQFTIELKPFKRCETRPTIAPDHKTIFLVIELRGKITRVPESWVSKMTSLSSLTLRY